MNLLSFLNLASLIALLLALLFAIRNRRANPELHAGLLLLVILFGAVASLGGVLRWAGISRVLDPAEAVSNALIPLAFFGFFAVLVFKRRSLAQASRNQVLAALHAVTEREGHPEDPFVALRDLIGRLGTLLGFDFVGLYQRQGEDSLRLAVSWQMSPELAQSIDRLDSLITSLSRVLETGEPLVVRSVGDFPDPITQVIDQHGYTSVGIFPLSTRTRAEGILILGMRSRFSFPAEVVDLLKFVGRHLGEVLLNDRMTSEWRERSAELARVQDSRKLFLSMVSHDLRDPLTVIKGAMLVIHQYLDRSSNEEVRRAVEMSSGSTRRLEKLITDMLDLARLDSGGVKLEFVPIDPVLELRMMGEEVRSDADGRGISVELDLPSRLPPMEVDKGRFHQMVRSLLANAVAFTPAGGRITLSAEAQGENVQIRVSDTGMGIPEAELPRIFEMFYRGSASRSQQPGSGLGLSIVREVVRLHGGQVLAESSPGRGSVFTITLPRVHLP